LQVLENNGNGFAKLPIYYGGIRAFDLCSPRAMEKAKKPPSLDGGFDDYKRNAFFFYRRKIDKAFSSVRCGSSDNSHSIQLLP
jgi:hypothetical protein